MVLSPAIRFRCLALSFLLILAGCSSTPLRSSKVSDESSGAYPALPPAGSGRGGYYMDDGPGDVTPAGLEKVPDAEPKVEPYSRYGNKPYVVFGKRYVPITDDRPFSQEGYGSWYGKKFQGQKTSSGELYDMYKMTAAHPTLPLPSYARVTNLSNGNQVIVRVNDRGPFHSSRVIDLSYTAALKLGYIGKGSAKLKVERLLPADIAEINASSAQRGQSSDESQTHTFAVSTVSMQSDTRDVSPEMSQSTSATAPRLAAQPAIVSSHLAPPTATQSTAQATPPVTPQGITNPSAVSRGMVATAGFYLQFGAYSQLNNAEAARSTLSQNIGAKLPALTVESSNSLYKVFSGPFSSREEAMSAAMRAQQDGIVKPVIVQR